MTEVIPMLIPGEPLSPPQSQPWRYRGDETSRRLYDAVAPALVEIVTDKGTGSAFFVGDGELATDSHVVLGASDIYAITASHHKYKAHLEKLSDTGDVVALKLDDFNEKGQKVLEFETAGLYKSEKVYGFGFPFGSDRPYVSPGTVESAGSTYDLVDKDATAAQYKNLGDSDREDLVSALARPVIAGRMHLEPGNSGGPIVDEAGKVVGIADFSNGKTLDSAYFTPAEVFASLAKQDSKFQLPASGALPFEIRRRNGDIRPPFDWRSVRFK